MLPWASLSNIVLRTLLLYIGWCLPNISSMNLLLNIVETMSFITWERSSQTNRSDQMCLTCLVCSVFFHHLSFEPGVNDVNHFPAEVDEKNWQSSVRHFSVLIRDLCWSGERVAGSGSWEAMVTFRKKVNTVQCSGGTIINNILY